MSKAPARHTVRPFLPNNRTPTKEVMQTNIAELSNQVQQTAGEDHENAKHALLWKLMSNYIPAEKGSVQVSFVNHIEYTIARSRFTFDNFSAYLAASYSVRDRLIELFNDTQEYFIASKSKQVYYVSCEFLVGRFLRNALLNLGMEDLYRDSLAELDISIDDLYSEEYDPGLGNGGLGRLAACFMDSLATLNYPGWGYGLMYSFGMFKQTIGADGSQLEVPDYWLNYGDPWRLQRPTVTYSVHFYGYCEQGVWHPSVTINAQANDFLIPGFDTDNTLALRLWSSKPTSELDEGKFRSGDYYQAIEHKQRCENLTSVLYPNDNTPAGKEMRLMQEYFLSSATLQDVINRLKTQQKASIRELPKYAAIQLNDTHPAIMVAELLRILMDEEELEFQEAFEITNQVFSYTCHTLMPEALEKWPLPLFENLLPRHLEIIYQLNQVFLDSVRYQFQCSDEVIASLSIIEESNPKMVRTANLAVIGSHTVNGVAQIHSDLMKKSVFKEFAMMWPEKFQNKTNGVTVRRWLHHCNPGLSTLITRVCGNHDWALKAGELKALMTKINDPLFLKDWATVKLNNKLRLARWVQEHLGVTLNPNLQLFDIQVKRIHEYKRQTLNIFSVIYRYLHILEASPEERAKMVPRAILIGGKAAPGYYAAKQLIKLINNVSRVINADTEVGDLLKLVFLPNYNVSLAEMIIPATDICQQISTAGTEASGTSNMKFAFNAGLIIGTWDGANIEIGHEIGNENVFFFGAKVEEVDRLRATAKTRPINPKLARVFQSIRSGLFGDASTYDCLMNPIEHGDHYLVSVDFDDYLLAQERVDQAYLDTDRWVKMCLTSTANMGAFSSDRTINEYAQQIWKIQQTPLPLMNFDEAGLPIPSNSTGNETIGSVGRRHFGGSVGSLGKNSPSQGSFGSRVKPAPTPEASKPSDEDEVEIKL